MKYVFKILAAFAVFSLAACAQFGAQLPTNADQRLAYSLDSVMVIRKTAADTLASHQITPAAAQRVQSFADQARGLIDGAHAVQTAIDSTTLDQKLLAIAVILDQAQAAKGQGAGVTSPGARATATANSGGALGVLSGLVDGLANLATGVQSVSAIVAKAQAEGRLLTPAEWQAITITDDLARAALEVAIAKGI